MMENNSDSECSDFEVKEKYVKKYVNLTNFSRFTTNCSSFEFKYGVKCQNLML